MIRVSFKDIGMSKNINDFLCKTSSKNGLYRGEEETGTSSVRLILIL